MRFTICLMIAACFIAATAAAADPAWIPSLTRELDQRADDGRFSGAVLIAVDGEILFAQARGFADSARNIPNTVDTKFRFGSMGKMFTAVAVLQLAQAGKVELDAPLGRYLRDYPDADTAKVTLHQLLTHTGGTGDIFGPEFAARRAELKALRDYVALYGHRKPAFPPGSRHEYSNYGFILLGRVIEVVSGQSYDAYVREHVFLPAGMTSTGNEPEGSGIAGLAEPYTGDARSLTSATDRLPFRGTSAGGGYSTVGDLLRFAQALEYDKGSKQLLDAEHVKLLTTGKVDTPRPGWRYAYGFEDAQLRNGLHRLGHGGGAPGMNGLLGIFPQSGAVIVVLANRDPPAAMDIERLVVDTVVASGQLD